MSARNLGLEILFCALLLAFPPSPGAEPYIAFREGFKCSTCHVNHTGGGKRTDFGLLFTQTEIAPLLTGLSEQSLDFSAQIGSNFFLGADFMAVNETLFSVDETRDGQSYAQDLRNTFDVRSGNLYLEAQLAPGRLSFYLDETVTPSGASSREAFILLEGLPGGSYLKAGRMLLPYGIRVWDDETFVRQASGFNYDNQDMGVEWGLEPGPLALHVALSNGTLGGRDDNAGKQVSSSGSLFLKNAVVGGSFSWNESRGSERLLFGPFAGVRAGPLTLLGEADWIGESGDSDQDQFAFFASLNYWTMNSINARLAFDYLDPYDEIEEDERSRLVLGLDAFLTPNLVASAFYRLKESVPQDVQGNADALLLSLHAFF